MNPADPSPPASPGAAGQTRAEAGTAPLLVVMGVTGSGKTTVGQALADRLGLPFADADDFHSPASVAKMTAGIPLDDDDRMPWLRAIGAWLADHAAGGAVVSCSALKRSYRDVLRAAAPPACFVHLAGDREVVRRRVAGRPGHFMPASLVDSQYAALQPLQDDERGVVLDFTRGVEQLVEDYLAAACPADLPGPPRAPER
ncbi:gluconokinase [Sphaerisporangium melleum]|uniref:Gluconokinase n=1 Tax=Sphaerisporangium melleum TaxID=321316 RepID=A0A917VPS9_9ACTN|nr:gluconokinase [Sphaerisporangium melleum]GGL02209.1 gluconokinase [Sphaerisporangium melleum]GII72222.1 gluconokinase [Sphaerisporangium melleum]